MEGEKVNPIPNIITGLSLVSGCISISMAIQTNYELASYLILLSAVFDLLDGIVARSLKAVSSFGKVFDSLVDLVSFGVAPSVLMYKIMIMSLTFNNSIFEPENPNFTENIFMLSAFLLTLFAAIRLARFTSSDKETEYFKGLPTPASAILVAALSIIIATSEDSALQYFIFDTVRLLIIIIGISVLMVINLPMMKLKFQNKKIKDNFMKYLLILGSLILLIIFQFAGIPLVIILYIVLSIVNTLIKEPA